MSLGTVLSAQAPEPTWPASAGPSPYASPYPPPYVGDYPQPRAKPKRRFVFAFLPSLTFGTFVIPSVGPAFFFGRRLERGPWTLGYQLTLSTGFGDRYWNGIYAHRHHVTALRAFGATGRGFASVGGGAAFLLTVPVVEAEGRVGVRFGDKRYGIVAAQLRLGWNIGHREQAPMPQFGVVFGVALL